MNTKRYALQPMLILTAILCVACSACATAQEAQTEEGFTSLFNGENLDGWRKVGGGATYRVDNGEIVGTVGPGGNTFLRTEQTFADFEFRCEFRWDVRGNSGIQYRSHQQPDDNGEENGRVYGYQYELDHRVGRAWSGGLFEEGRRHWLQDVSGDENAHKREAIDAEGWNQIVIRCEGNHLQTWLNGVQITDYTDEADEALSEGFFALQVHAGNQGVMRWRNIRVMQLNTDQ